MNKKKLPPSRIKYETNNPTVSARLPKEKQKKLLDMLKTTDTTLTQLLFHFINEYEPKIIPIEEAQKKGSEQGRISGFQQAKLRYAVKYPCSKCRKEITVTSEDEKKAIRKFMVDSGWHHGDCNHPLV